MTFWLYHVGVSVCIGLLFGALIDLDHGITRNNLRCALSTDYRDCSGTGLRGVFHDLRLWALFSLAWVVYSLHLLMDGVF